MLGLTQHGWLSIEGTARLKQGRSLEKLAAAVALVTTRRVETAVRTGALDVAVGQEATQGGCKPLLLTAPAKAAVSLQREEESPGHAEVVFGVGRGEQVIAQSKLAREVEEAVVVTLVDGLGRYALDLGTDRDRRAVGIRARDEEHPSATEAMVAGQDVGRQVSAGQVADVDLGVGIGPGGGDEKGRIHERISLRCNPGSASRGRVKSEGGTRKPARAGQQNGLPCLDSPSGSQPDCARPNRRRPRPAGPGGA